MNNYHIIGIRWIAPTGNQPGRIKLSSHRFQDSITVPFDYTFNSMSEQSMHLLNRIGFKVIGYGAYSDRDDVIITSTFEPLKHMLNVHGNGKKRKK
jgi:hypothetical protein